MECALCNCCLDSCSSATATKQRFSVSASNSFLYSSSWIFCCVPPPLPWYAPLALVAPLAISFHPAHPRWCGRGAHPVIVRRTVLRPKHLLILHQHPCLLLLLQQLNFCLSLIPIRDHATPSPSWHDFEVTARVALSILNWHGFALPIAVVSLVPTFAKIAIRLPAGSGVWSLEAGLLRTFDLRVIVQFLIK